MLNKKSRLLIAIIASIVFMMPSILPVTHSYWTSKVNGSFSVGKASIKIGEWSSTPLTPCDFPNTFNLNKVSGDTIIPIGATVCINGEFYTNINVDTYRIINANDIFKGDRYLTWDILRYQGFNWVPNTVFRADRVVVYTDQTGKKTVYRLAQNGSGIPNNQNEWLFKPIAATDLDYMKEIKYNVGATVYYNDRLYRVYNDVLANKNIPGTANGGWSRIDTYMWDESIAYQVDQIAVYNGVVYRAMKPNINSVPSANNTTTNYLNPGNAIWHRYLPTP